MSQESSSAPTANTGKRLDKLETTVEHLSKNVTGLQTTTESHGRVLNDVSHKIDQLVARGAAQEGTRGMVPTTTVTWGIGAFLSLLSIGVAVLVVFNTGIKERFRDQHDRRDILATEIRSKFDVEEKLISAAEARITRENDIQHSYLQAEINSHTRRVSDPDTSPWTTAMQTAFQEREFDPIREQVNSIHGSRFTPEDFQIFFKEHFMELFAAVRRLENRLTDEAYAR